MENIYWCNKCQRVTREKKCPSCGSSTVGGREPELD